MSGLFDKVLINPSFKENAFKKLDKKINNKNKILNI